MKTRAVLFLLTAAGALACGRTSSSGSDMPADGPRVVLDTARGAARASIVIVGIDRLQLNSMRDARLSPDAWKQIMRVSVAGNDSVAMVGLYALSDSAIHFHPLFPLDPGRGYSVRFDPGPLASKTGLGIITGQVALPASGAKPATKVLRVYPTSAVVPENLLRLYIEFSAPMSRTSGLGFVRLLDSKGQEVPYAFLPLEADFWNDDATRFTLFLDPGRVKRGILANEQMGRALKEGETYTVAIDSTWRDARGQPLVNSYRHSMRAGPADNGKIALAAWKVQPPRAGTRDLLVVNFPKPLDSGLLRRALGVLDAGGRQIPGEVDLTAGETTWGFTPQNPWRPGNFQLLVLSILEDVAGNRIDRPFEVDMFERADKDDAPEKHLVSFLVR